MIEFDGHVGILLVETNICHLTGYVGKKKGMSDKVTNGKKGYHVVSIGVAISSDRDELIPPFLVGQVAVFLDGWR